VFILNQFKKKKAYSYKHFSFHMVMALLLQVISILAKICDGQFSAVLSGRELKKRPILLQKSTLYQIEGFRISDKVLILSPHPLKKASKFNQLKKLPSFLNPAFTPLLATFCSLTHPHTHHKHTRHFIHTKT